MVIGGPVVRRTSTPAREPKAANSPNSVATRDRSVCMIWETVPIVPGHSGKGWMNRLIGILAVVGQLGCYSTHESAPARGAAGSPSSSSGGLGGIRR